MNNQTLLTVLVVLFMCSCSPRVVTNFTSSTEYEKLNADQDVIVLGIEDSIPQNSIKIGDVRISDTGFSTNCGYDVVIGKAKDEAREIGGDAIKLVKHIEPNFWGSSCHQINADILKLACLDSVVNARAEKQIVETGDNSYPMLQKGDEKSATYSKVRLSFAGGWSYNIAKIGDNVPDDFKDYAKELKSGYTYNGDFTYFFNEGNGLGLRFSQYKSKNSIDNIYVNKPDGSTEIGEMSDNITITTIGPMWATRTYNRTGTNCFIANLGIGYMGYKNKGVLIYDITQTGSTLGTFIDLGYDLGISDDAALGFQVSYYAGKLMKIDQTFNGVEETIEFEDKEFIGLGRIELTVALRFNL